jgi:CheY-like chemotaxis protein
MELQGANGNLTAQHAEPAGPATSEYTPVVLVADDEAVVRTVLHSMLRRLGCDVMLAETGQEAIDVYAAGHRGIDMVIFDLFLPDMTGERLYGELRAINPQTRAVLTTGNCEHEMLDDLIAAGVSGILPKPFDVAMLRAQVGAVLAP